MTIKLLAFGIAKDILKAQQLDFNLEKGATIAVLKHQLEQHYPDFQKLAKLSFAVAEEYQKDDFVLSAHQEVVIIPPVAGG